MAEPRIMNTPTLITTKQLGLQAGQTVWPLVEFAIKWIEDHHQETL
jgi:hypothetical protein